MNLDKLNIKTIKDTGKTFIISLFIAIFLKSFVVDATIVNGASMANTLETNDFLLVDKLNPQIGEYERGDVVIVHAPDHEKKLYVKRVIGLPGERVDLIDGTFYIDGHPLEESYINTKETEFNPLQENYSWELLDTEYFIVGDNRIKGASNDSRNFGPVSKYNFVGRAFFRLAPLNKAGSL